jgi:hypothetical protein
MIPALIKQCSDPTYFTKRELPPPLPADQAEERAKNSCQPDADGWVAACETAEVPKGELTRFDVGPRYETMRIYVCMRVCS